MMEAVEQEDQKRLDALVQQLRPEALDADLYLGDAGQGKGRLFGGLVAGQSLMAASLTVPDEVMPHSLHAYFLRPGRHVTPIRFVVDRIRDGRTYVTRRVVAHQAGEAIFSLSISFCRPEEGIAHQDAMPDAPAPEDSPLWDEVKRRSGEDPASWTQSYKDAIEMRVTDAAREDSAEAHPPQRQLWMRPAGVMPEDPRVHAALILYASDRSLVRAAALPHPIPWERRMMASLDHALWFHRPPRFDDWLLYDTYSPVAHGGRGLNFGSMFTRDGVLVASVAQEGLIRVRREES